MPGSKKPKSKKPKQIQRAPKPKKEVPQLDIEKMFEEIITAEAEPAVRQKRRRKQKKFDADVDPTVIELIHRIEQIYKMNNYHSEDRDLRRLDAKQLRVHLNRLQWGHIAYVTKENKFPVIDEYPEGGFCCKTYGYNLWVNSQHCQRRSMYPELYDWCRYCERWKSDGGD